MSRQPTALLPPLASPRPEKSALAGASLAGLSLTGVLLLLIGGLVVASGYRSMRPTVLGLALHPTLVPIAIAFPLVFLSRIGVFPQRVLICLSTFVGIYFLSILNGMSLSASEIFKMGAAFVTILTCALLVRKRGDFVAGALGLCIAVALLAARGLSDDRTNQVMDGANKNSYSLFALPALLLTGFICLRMKRTPLIIKGTMVGCMLLALFVIFLGGNRSGYLGAVLVGAMLFWEQRGRGMVLVGIVALALFLLISQFGDTRILDRRLEQTVEGNRSDDHRIHLVQHSFRIALENPIIGVSPQQFPNHLAVLMDRRGGRFESHNVVAHVMGGSGFICLAALGFVGWSLWFPFPKHEYRKKGPDDPIFEARKLMRMFVVLWFVRGMFTREILFNPAFNIAIGLSIGLFILAVSSKKEPISPYAPLTTN